MCYHCCVRRVPCYIEPCFDATRLYLQVEPDVPSDISVVQWRLDDVSRVYSHFRIDLYAGAGNPVSMEELAIIECITVVGKSAFHRCHCDGFRSTIFMIDQCNRNIRVVMMPNL